ncbi:MAG: dUTP diphosphatase [Ezakiella sp.]|mgnify:FL=1|uniref:Deoxyuridine 5'-triphosphate nucleotidohydrolase n=1 Tax=Ezakiella coagulans TaxID=46507 RepID=A0A2U1E2M7_9FIRM|nr:MULTISPECIES: dUTP diphosphatase [Ezakiella]KGF07278.1 deoxyuridine 5'-triphosphate nucleotidohydrolase [Tissierellia bacterium S7-1-4]MDD7730768.1 dUTP diphosphatase [Eubacteriales bacterium]MDY6079390.1 dUTP diphosphatase [Ezakiella sp.]PVY94171.1 dUTP pyrophosphatase [Ezakiella coagulans]UQK60810.1 dUTP diphosphatase [Ezakiella coagulans]
MEVKIINKSNNALPEYQTSGAAGMDIRAFVPSDIKIKPGEVKLVPTGLYLEIPKGYEIQVRARSGLALKNSIGVANGIGTIDSDYRGELCVILVNFGQNEFVVKNGDRIAQMVLNKYEPIEFVVDEELSSTERGEGGFGSSGV